MEISRTEIRSNIRKVCDTAKNQPVYMTHYGDITEVIMSKEMFDEWKEIVDKYKEENK